MIRSLDNEVKSQKFKKAAVLLGAYHAVAFSNSPEEAITTFILMALKHDIIIPLPDAINIITKMILTYNAIEVE